jgi:hypothetical protein
LTVDPALLVDLVDDHVGHQFGGVPIKEAGPDRSKKAPILMVSSAATLLPKKISIKATAIVASRFIRFILSSFHSMAVVA